MRNFSLNFVSCSRKLSTHKSIHFDATEKLQAFIEKKVAKLEKSFEDIKKVEVQLKVVKPAAALNKETSVTVSVPNGNPIYVAKTCDTFEEGIDLMFTSIVTIFKG